jgi:hypothetical protein
MSQHTRSLIPLLALLCLIGSVVPASAAPSAQATGYLSAQYFTWREYSEGRRLLEETGPVYAGGAVLDLLLTPERPHSLVLRGKAELFGGVVDYNGETQAPNPVPVQTRVSYLGTRQELDLGVRHAAADWTLEPFLGLGYRWWLRGLQDSTSTAGDPVSGYTEYWQTFYARLGGRARYHAASGVTLFAEAGGKYPLYTGNTVDFVGSGKTTFRPDPLWSAFAETGASWRHLKVSASYEGFRFDASPVVVINSNSGPKPFFQPVSSSDLFGLNLGWTF